MHLCSSGLRGRWAQADAQPPVSSESVSEARSHVAAEESRQRVGGASRVNWSITTSTQ